jgi:hypothetical protein
MHAIAGHAVTGAHDARELLDVDVEQLAGDSALIPLHLRLGIQVAQTTQAMLAKQPAYSRHRQMEALGDFPGRAALAS